MKTSEQADLSWMAFRYISEELSQEELDAFEQHLATDQNAREAVARAVKLSQAIASLPEREVTAASPPSRFSRPLAWGMVAAAVCVAFVFGSSLSNSRLGHDIGEKGVDEKDSQVAGDDGADATFDETRVGHLVSVWSEAEFFVNSLVEDAVESTDDESDEFSPDDLEAEFEVPGWMIAAVSSNMPDQIDPLDRPREN